MSPPYSFRSIDERAGVVRRLGAIVRPVVAHDLGDPEPVIGEHARLADRLRAAMVELAVDARPEAARRDGPDGAPVQRRDRGALAGGRAALGLQPDPHARRALFQLALDAGRAREAALLAAPLLDRPGQARLDRRRGRIDVVAVEAEARLEPERVACAAA